MAIGFLLVALPVIFLWYVQGQKEKGKSWAFKAFPWSIVLIILSIAFIYVAYFVVK